MLHLFLASSVVTGQVPALHCALCRHNSCLSTRDSIPVPMTEFPQLWLSSPRWARAARGQGQAVTVLFTGYLTSHCPVPRDTGVASTDPHPQAPTALPRDSAHRGLILTIPSPGLAWGSAWPVSLSSYQQAWGARVALLGAPLLDPWPLRGVGVGPAWGIFIVQEGSLQLRRGSSSRHDQTSVSLLSAKLYVSSDLGKKWTLLRERVTKDHVFW